jgi:hypothetical protein
MRLTIIRSDGAVYLDSILYESLDMSCVPVNIHALQWFDSNGWIEFVENTPNEEITELPSWANLCISEWEAADYAKKHPPPPPPPTAQENKESAVSMLVATDWSALPDVADPLKSNPYLANASAFNAYRNAIRLIVINPTAGRLDWPTKPDADWRTSE